MGVRNNSRRRILSIDLETYSDVDLGKCGVYRYVEGDFHILLLAYAFDDDPVRIVDLACGESMPQEVIDAIHDEHIVKSAWNAAFERTCLSQYFETRLSPDSWQCSMVWAASLSLPLKLKTAAEVLKTGEQKDDAGERLIRYFSVPCKPTKSNGGRTRNLPEHDPEGWQTFKEYCLQDVRTERDIRKRLERFPLIETEWDYYHMDQRINDRGVLIDHTLVEQAIACDAILSEQMTNQAYALTGLENPNSVSQLKGWLEERNIHIDSLSKKNVAEQIKELEETGTDAEALEMLKLRLQMSKSSVKKYQAADRYICSDGRAHGLFQFSGANRTQRWAGRGIQLQNLPQNHISTLDEARELLKLGAFDVLEMVYGNTPDILSQLIRTMLIAKPGHQFIVADFSAIEARVLAWLADEQWRLDAFHNGEDIYCASASQMFGVPVEKHGVNGELRQKGKVAELACIARGMKVKTDRGMVAIQRVKKDMKVWDGYEFVSHDGVVYRGFKDVIRYDGLTATSDHQVFVKNKWRDFYWWAAYRIPLRKHDIKRKHKFKRDKAPVFDILNAGPRHQYEVEGVIVHNCGYGGAAGALISMGALDMGLKEEELPDLIRDWRDSNPNIVKFWWDVEKAAVNTVKDHQDRRVGRIGIQFSANTLWLVLPSGRRLAYIKPKLMPNRFGRMAINYEGLNANNKWMLGETYSGKLVENCTQATARDLLAEAMWRMEQAGLNIVGHVHDEVILEVPEGSVTVDEVCAVMNENPVWADGLPLASAGYTGKYYFKD